MPLTIQDEILRLADMSESEFMTHVRLTHPPGDRVKLTVLRGGKRKTLRMEVE